MFTKTSGEGAKGDTWVDASAFPPQPRMTPFWEYFNGVENVPKNKCSAGRQKPKRVKTIWLGGL